MTKEEKQTMTDPAVLRGINPEICFERHHTLIQGDDYCDHCCYQ